MKLKIVSNKNNLLKVTITIVVDKESIGTARLRLEKKLVINAIFNRISESCIELAEVLPELAKNSFDSFIDRILETSYKGLIPMFSLIIEASYEKDILVIRFIDNGKPIKLDVNGKPVNRKRQKGIHFGGEHSGIKTVQNLLRTIGGHMNWQSLEDGTKTEIRIPATSIVFSR